MMHNIYIICRQSAAAVFSAALLLTLTACYSDDGNYDYRPPLDITVSGIDDVYELTPNGEHLQITPQVTPAGRDYTYFWTITPATATTAAAVDTIGRELRLDYAVNLRVGAYKLRFCATDRATGIFAYKEYLVNVTTDMATGWWVLKAVGDSTDIDFFAADKQKADIIHTANGRRMAGSPLGLMYTPSFWTFSEALLEDELTSAVFVASSGDVVALDYFTGQILSRYEDLFIELPPQRRVQTVFAGPSDVHVCIDGVVYTMFNSAYNKYKQFVLKTLGDYTLSPYKVSTHITLPLLFNDDNSSFCTLSRNSPVIDYFNDRTGAYSPTNMDMNLLFMGGKTGANEGDVALALMQQKDGQQYWLYNLRGNPSSVAINPINSRTALKADLQVLQAEHRALNQNNNIIYFVKDGRLWSCNLDSQSERMEEVTIDSGWEVSYMEFVKYDPYGLNDLWFDYLLIATHRDGRYRLQLHPLSAGRVQPAEKTFEGAGRVQRACYMNQVHTSYGSYVYTSTLF